MPMNTRGFKKVIQSVLSAEHRNSELSHCIHTFNRIAMTYLKKKIAAGSLHMNRIQLKLEDFAWDCIADLFERDEKGAFVQLKTYYEDYNLEEMSDREVFAITRRLVFSKVNDGIFRNFRSIDPALGKIIRNLKLAIQKENSVELRKRKDLNRIILSPNPELQKPLMPVEFLRIRLTQRLEAKMFISEALDELQNILVGQQLYRKAYPLVEAAKVLRYAYVQLHEPADERKGPKAPDTPLHKEDIDEYIQHTIDQVRADMYQTYVRKNKLSESVFRIYFQCIEDILQDAFVEESKSSSYFEHLSDYLEPLNRSTYREQHRGYLEYLVKKVRSHLLHKIRKEL